MRRWLDLLPRYFRDAAWGLLLVGGNRSRERPEDSYRHRLPQVASADFPE